MAQYLYISYVYPLIYFIFFSYTLNHLFSSVKSLSCLLLFATPWAAAQPGFPVHHQLPELAQTHAHRVKNVIQPSHSLSSPSPLALNLPQHQDLFQ